MTTMSPASPIYSTCLPWHCGCLAPRCGPLGPVPSVLLLGMDNAFRLGKRAKEMRKSASPVSSKRDWTDNAFRLNIELGGTCPVRFWMMPSRRTGPSRWKLVTRSRSASQAEAKIVCFTFIEGWYNPVRLHSALGYRSPMAYEQAMEVQPTEA